MTVKEFVTTQSERLLLSENHMKFEIIMPNFWAYQLTMQNYNRFEDMAIAEWQADVKSNRIVLLVEESRH